MFLLHPCPGFAIRATWNATDSRGSDSVWGSGLVARMARPGHESGKTVFPRDRSRRKRHSRSKPTDSWVRGTDIEGRLVDTPSVSIHPRQRWATRQIQPSIVHRILMNTSSQTSFSPLKLPPAQVVVDGPRDSRWNQTQTLLEIAGCSLFVSHGWLGCLSE